MNSSGKPSAAVKRSETRYQEPAPPENAPLAASDEGKRGPHTAARTFRAFSRHESPDTREAQVAVLWLLTRAGLYKSEDDVWEFFAQCITWFFDKRETFAKVDDREVCRQVHNRFSAFLQEEQRKASPTPDSEEETGIDEGETGTKEEKAAARERSLILHPGQPSVDEYGHQREMKGTSYTEHINPPSKEDFKREIAQLRRENRGIRQLKKTEPWLYEYQRRRLHQEQAIQRNPDLIKDRDRRASEAINKAIRAAVS